MNAAWRPAIVAKRPGPPPVVHIRLRSDTALARGASPCADIARGLEPRTALKGDAVGHARVPRRMAKTGDCASGRDYTSV
jgi:hypothetical protein